MIPWLSVSGHARHFEDHEHRLHLYRPRAASCAAAHRSRVTQGGEGVEDGFFLVDPPRGSRGPSREAGAVTGAALINSGVILNNSGDPLRF